MKILIIKLGLSETLDPEISKFSSLGDVLRTTPILHALKDKYRDSHISWLVDEASAMLLHANEMIDRLLIWDSFTGFQLMSERFDIVINLEKVGGLCAIANNINAWQKYGFRFNEVDGGYAVFEGGSEYAFDLCTKRDIKRHNNKLWQEVLIEMIGGEWKQQPYIVGYKPKKEEEFDIGFNIKVGNKFPEKAWPVENWEALESRLKDDNVKVSWQKGLSNLYEYMDWINQNEILISSDSLGLHLGLAFNKKVIGLFGPTSSKEVCFYGLGSSIDKHRMDDISVDEVYDRIKSLLQ